MGATWAVIVNVCVLLLLLTLTNAILKAFPLNGGHKNFAVRNKRGISSILNNFVNHYYINYGL